MPGIEEQMTLIKRGAVEIIQEDELKKKIASSIKEKTPLTVKAGFDPTAADIHLGHTVLLRKLKHFQELGHKVIFLIGDATAIIGDPSGVSQTRKTLTYDEVEKNVKTYVSQVSKILDTNNSAVFQLQYNSQWFSNYRDTTKPPPFTFDQFVELAQRYTVARLLERDDFQKRLKENKPISYLELFYPLMQGYDSVKLRSDVEIGGTDQKFNMLVGRSLQQTQGYDQKPQVVMTMPILEGLDGIQKMSKSLNNYIGINDKPKEMFGKVMSVSDEMMWKYYELLTDEDTGRIKSGVAGGRIHPKQAKLDLARIITAQYHDRHEAARQEREFERAFKEKGFPRDVKVEKIKADKFGKNFFTVPLALVLIDGIHLFNSKSEFKRKVKEGAVEVNGRRITDINAEVPAGNEHKIRVGKKFKIVYIIPPTSDY